MKKGIMFLVIMVIMPLYSFANDKKEKIAVFDPVTTMGEGTKIAVRELICQTVVNTDTYLLVERSMIEKVFEEQKFSNSGVVDAMQAATIGKLAGADKIMLSVLTKVENQILLTIKLIDVVSAQVVGQGTEFIDNDKIFQRVEPVTLRALKYKAENAYGNEENNSGKNRIVTRKNSWLKTPCYKGFIDLGFWLPLGEPGVTFSTTHGAQISPWVYLGVGAGCNLIPEEEVWGVPLYADFRLNFIKKRFAPVLDLRLGYSLGDIEGIYASVMPGFYMGIRDKLGFTISAGYQYSGEYIDYNYSYYHHHYDEAHGLVVKLSMDF